MNGSPFATLLGKRRDRAIAIILRTKEQEVDDFLTPEASSRLRKVILDQVNALADAAIDIVDANQQAAVTNELYWERLNEIYDLLAYPKDGDGG